MKLPHYLEILKDFYKDKLNFIDIGAYQGCITEKLLNAFSKSKGVLFEPTKDSYDLLSNKFSAYENIRLLRLALGNKKYETEFFVFNDAAQNSLLKVVDNSTDYTKDKIQVDTLDSVMESLNFLLSIDFIKIDTQGNDLNILKGGIKIINMYKPAILTEFIFVPLYKNQGSYYEQLAFMNKINYKLAGIYDVHFHESGCAAFADFLFLPEDKYERIANKISTGSAFFYNDPEILMREINNLNSVCDERLNLINTLSEEAQKRLEIINTLTAEIEKLKGKK